MTDNYLIHNLCELFKVKPNDSFTLPNKITYEQAVDLYDNFMHMYDYFLRTKNILIFLKPSHIMVINSTLFIPTNFEDLYSSHNLHINIYKPYDKNNPYISKSLKFNDKLPFNANTNIFMQSISIFILTLLEDDINSIYGTSLYWKLYNNLYA